MSESRPRCVVLGAGGHARVLLDGLLDAGWFVPVAILDADPAKHGGDIFGVPILGGDDLLRQMASRGVSHFLVGVGGVWNNGPRRRVFESALAAGLRPLDFQHPTAFCSLRARLGQGDQLVPQCTVNAGAVLGDNVVVNTSAVIEHNCHLENHVHVATGAKLCSTVWVGEGAHVGAGATVKQLVKIGEKAVVAAGAVVINDVPAGTLVAGVPAVPLPRQIQVRRQPEPEGK